MTEDRSLAEQVASWVPPWERPADAPPAVAAASVEVSEPPPANPPPLPEPPPEVEVETRPTATGTAQAAPAAASPAAASPGPAVPPPAPLADDVLRGALESILLVVDEPVADDTLAGVLGEPLERIAFALAELSAEYTAAGRGIDVRRVAGGWRLYTRPEYADYVQRFVLDGQQARLSQAALETLAVVAYKQPVTRSRISAIRGVNCDGVTRTLVTRGLIAECGTESDSGAYLYRTTPLFLEKLGLESVEQLPALAPFLPDDVEEIVDV
ncbi:hypothetical protein GCM10010124_32120 [Pilimelia terevasa]|uniref:Segregation and condensation protein B n=1 Tax=Pilimelia terevasa TaxID=53372 RepID=A0A8J3FLR2_9ACTN|nr:SMC-Scp complex subunit ScpB [Pilimelia terevasa]GGK37042.1 hypothetical protein GCM10010124_32120 [Pilimelia terevasa]